MKYIILADNGWQYQALKSLSDGDLTWTSNYDDALLFDTKEEAETFASDVGIGFAVQHWPKPVELTQAK